MNERIRELAEQARAWAEVSYKNQNEQFTSHWDNPVRYTPSQLFEQKFAELIVQDCMILGFNAVYEVADDSKAFAVYQNIKEHFGVE